MSPKVGRNDPCPCGSGKKYKKCCANVDADAEVDTQERKSFDGAVPRALDWLTNKHRRAVKTALEELLFDNLSEDEYNALSALDQATWQSIHINATEWLLAEGYITVKDEHKRVSEYLLGPGGPLFTVDQRNWIAQLGERPLRLYEVTDVIAGQQMTLCDVLDSKAQPVTVHEKAGSDSVLLGQYVGFRIMEVGGHYELSGATYPFSLLKSQEVAEQLHAVKKQFGRKRKGLQESISTIILRKWLEQFYAPMPMPAIRDVFSGESMLLITDYYNVNNWDALASALKTQTDVDGSRETGWNRLMDCENGQTRSLASINIETSPDRISLFYRAQSYADKGRPWFEALAGNAVKFISREITDPIGAMKNRQKQEKTKPLPADPDISPEIHTQVIEQTYHRMYASWADEVIPRLDGKTPRQAIKTPAGLERVKGLLRMYEAREKEQAAQEGRKAVSFAFLWKSLDISP
ncbi:SEC-C motif-containing protein [Nitrosomonas sp. Nm51]|uniref:YecA family protein n=1 Tax=Nitrosomonas sp. Nm51 TaxID=133720 RepID=UPI0008ADC64D|nr:SEC-C metal-binding domain-containing protein [Nitrosomonas sp. Nm51]SEQ91401.1 SEC-C motif-containing protein [Nitrosomonas sp. Nm51]